MTPQEALQLLDQATQPGVRVDRIGYIRIQQAIETLAKLMQPQPPQEATEDVPSTT